LESGFRGKAETKLLSRQMKKDNSQRAIDKGQKAIKKTNQTKNQTI